MMNCPTRRKAVVYPNIYYQTTVLNDEGADRVPNDARGDYAACAGDQYFGAVRSGSPGSAIGACLGPESWLAEPRRPGQCWGS